MLQVNCYISHVADASANIILAEQEWTLWTTNQASKKKIRSRIAVCFLYSWRGLPAVSWCWQWLWNQLVPTVTWPKLKHHKHHMGLKNASRTGAKVKELLQCWQPPGQDTNGSVLDSKFTTANAEFSADEPLRVVMGLFSYGLLKTPPEYNTTTAFCYIPMSPPQLFSLFQIRNGASPQLDTSQCSLTSSGKEWLFSFTLSITTDLELLVLIFSSSASLLCHCLVFWGQPRICKLLNTLWGHGVHRDIQKPVGHSPEESALIDPALKEWGVCFNLKHFMTVRAISSLSEGKHVCTVTPHVTLQFYLATEDKLGNVNVLCFHLACSMILRVKKFTASLASWDTL